MLKTLTVTYGRVLPLFDTFLIKLWKQITVLTRKKHTIIYKTTGGKPIAIVRQANL